MTPVSREEKIWVFKISALVMALTLLPYLLGYALSAKDRQYIGLSSANSADYNTYLAWMKQAQEGHFLFKLKYTTEPHASVVFHPLFLALGFLSRGTGLPLILISHGARLVFGLLLLNAAYHFIAYFLPERAHRRTAFFLVCFSSGLGGFYLVGWVIKKFLTTCALYERAFSWSCFHRMSLSSLALGDEELPIDLWVPESVTFWSLYGMFLFPASQLFLVRGFLTFLQFAENNRSRHALFAAAYFFFLFFIHPYDALIVYPVLSVYILLLFWKKKTAPSVLSRLPGLTAVFCLPLAPVLYHFYVLHRHPLFLQWSHSPRFSPPFPYIVTGFGLVFLFSLAAAAFIFKQKKKESFLFLFVWCALVFFLMYLPVSFQRRLVEGAHIPFCALASYGIHSFFELVRRKKEARGKIFDKQKAVRVVLILASFSNISVCISDMRSLAHAAFPYFLSSEIKQAFHYMDTRTSKNDIVLSSYAIGNFIPAQSGNTVYLGHYDQTLNAPEKYKDVLQFYGKKTSCVWRHAFLKKQNIRYVFFSSEERSLRGLKTLSCPFLTPVFQEGNTVIYKRTD